MAKKKADTSNPTTADLARPPKFRASSALMAVPKSRIVFQNQDSEAAPDDVSEPPEDVFEGYVYATC